MQWLKEAKCRQAGLHPNFFHPKADAGRPFMVSSAEHKRDKDAKEQEVAQYCNGCPVKEQCLEFALVNLPFGVAGGKTELERKNIIRRRRRRQLKAA